MDTRFDRMRLLTREETYSILTHTHTHSGHAHFVPFHPGLMSRSTQRLSAPFEGPFRTEGYFICHLFWGEIVL